MRTPLSIFILCILAMNARSQRNSIPYLICTDGLLMNTYKIGDDAVNPNKDTIPLRSARSIFALGGMRYADHRFENLIIKSFILTIVSGNGDTLRLTGKESRFREDMMAALKAVEMNTQIYIEGILAAAASDLELNIYSHLYLMSFIVK